MYKPGQMLQTTVLLYSLINQNLAGVDINSGVDTTIATYQYTPLSFHSNIIVEYFTKYTVSGNSNINTDAFTSRIKVNTSGISEGYQQWIGSDSGGVGTRSGTIFPLMGSYTNSDMSSKTIIISAYRTAGDDNLHIITDVGSWLKITEIYR